MSWRTRNGKHFAKLYGVWNTMRQRCHNKNAVSYDRYGARGIKVCEEWWDYAEFRKWAVTNGYKKGLTIERMDNRQGYSPGNCTWATRKEQASNTRRNLWIEYNGKVQHLRAWITESGLPFSTFRNRILMGWPMERILSTPSPGYVRKKR